MNIRSRMRNRRACNSPIYMEKEYVQIWDKMEKGEQISKEDFTKFAEYANQRESEYKRRNLYKAEADNARTLTEAIAPFAQELANGAIASVESVWARPPLRLFCTKLA